MATVNWPAAVKPTLPTDDEIVAFCKEHPPIIKNHCIDRYTVYPSETAPIAYIKSKAITFRAVSEARNQRYALRQLKKIPPEQRVGIRIPEVYRVIVRSGMVYIVMEYVHGETLQAILDKKRGQGFQSMSDHIIRALKLFLSFEVPKNVAPGPVGGGLIKHPLFRDREACVEYKSVKQMESHLNRMARMARIPYLSFLDERLCFCFSDLYPGNFMFTKAGHLYVVDFDLAAFLPVSFMSFALKQPQCSCNPSDAFEELGLPKDKLMWMNPIQYYVCMSVPNAGLPLSDDEEATPSSSNFEKQRREKNRVAGHFWIEHPKKPRMPSTQP